MSSGKERVQQNLVNFFSCLVTTAAYCEGEGWPGFRDYLTGLNQQMGNSRQADDGDRMDICGSIVIMKALMASPDLIGIIADRALKERGRTYN